MSYIGNQPFNASFITDSFSGTGSQTVYNLTVGPGSANAVLVVISGVLQPPSAYSVIGQVLTFSSPPPAGSNNIVVRYLALPASSVTTSAYRNVSEFTAASGQTTFIPAAYTPGFVEVFRNGVRLNSSDFTATNGTTIVLVNGAWGNDAITIVGFYISSVLNAIPSTPGIISSTYLDVGLNGGVGAMIPPSGTSAQRPAIPSAGMWRYNTTFGYPEVYNGSSWETAFQYQVQALVVAGGGAGGQDTAGGGGGGGVIYVPNYEVVPGTTYIVTVGGGGTRPTGGGQLATQQGSNSSFTATNYLNAVPLIAIGGGGGTGSANTGAAGTGGNGGGAGNSTGIAGAGIYGQGNYGNATGGAAGGGGSGQSPLNSSNGSNGAATYITGSLTYYGGGGGGTTNGGTYSGGLGGGGTNSGGTSYQASANNGTTNTGGGGSGHYGSWGGAGNGGSGIVIISYQSATQRGTGGTVTTYTSGGVKYYVHTFLTSGTYVA
jgi:hypothetical protein